MHHRIKEFDGVFQCRAFAAGSGDEFNGIPRKQHTTPHRLTAHFQSPGYLSSATLVKCKFAIYGRLIAYGYPAAVMLTTAWTWLQFRSRLSQSSWYLRFNSRNYVDAGQ